MIMTVMRMVKMFMMNVKSRYLAISGMVIDVGGRILETRSRKTIEGEQDGDAHRHLLAGVGGQIEDRYGEERDEDARNDEIHRVEQRLASDLQA
jgi:hypothetical protein